MKSIRLARYFWVSRILHVLAVIFAMQTDAAERKLINSNWHFQPGDFPKSVEHDFDDSNWQKVTLPHDWSITSIPSPEASSGGAGGFYATGIGWYRYAFPTSPNWHGKRVAILFESVYENAEVWLNGRKLGTHHYGYTPFRFDLTELLQFEGMNILAVRVDNSQQPNSRWYSGSGIYRPVWLLISNQVHFEYGKTFVELDSLESSKANVSIHSVVQNRDRDSRELDLHAIFLDSQGNTVIRQSSSFSIGAGEAKEAATLLEIDNPTLWSPENSYLYRLQLQLLSNGEILDVADVPIGLRRVKFSAERGLLLNDRQVLLCGANVHHDHGILGAMSYPSAERRRVELLKESGFNAIRTSHNPPSTAFLNACDEIGMLVVDEAFDGWAAKKTEYDYAQVFESDWKKDLTAMILRDRNHPSVIMWSIGNEVYERGKPEGAELARRLSSVVRELDSSRPVTAGINGLGSGAKWSDLDGFYQSLDIAGYNYELRRHAEDHYRIPLRVIMSTESYPEDVFVGWETVKSYPHVIGDFVWSGIDYLGEAGIGRVFEPSEKVIPHWEGSHFPWHGGSCGDIDLTGLRKPLSHYRQIVWDRGEKLYAAVRVPRAEGRQLQKSQWSQEPASVSWTWPGWEGEELTLEVYSRYPRVRVELNGKLVGEQPTGSSQQFRTKFALPYQPGELRVIGLVGGEEVETFDLRTAGNPALIQLMADRNTLTADGQDLSFVTAEITDAQEERCPNAINTLRYRIQGPAEILAVGTSDLTSLYPYQSLEQPVFEGRAMVVIRAQEQPGEIKLKVESDGLKAAILSIVSQSP